MKVLLVATGGALGSVARYGVSTVVQRLTPGGFPSGTFVVNLAGCLAFGVLVGGAEQRFVLTPAARAFLLVGVLGGFTTFSAFTYDNALLVQHGATLRACANAIGQVVLGLAAFWSGYALFTA